MSAKDSASTDVVGDVQKGYAFDGPALELGALVVDGDGAPGCRGADPAGDGQPARPGRRRHRHRQDQDAAADGRAALGCRRAGVRRRHQGRPVGHGRAGRGERPDDAAGPPRSARTGARSAARSSCWPSGGQGEGIPLRATMTSFGPTLLAKVLGLNEVQESSLGLVFHFADKAGLPMLDLKDLRAVVQFLTSDEGKDELKELGGLSRATAGVILRELIAFEDQGADAVLRRARVRHRGPDAGRRAGPRHRVAARAAAAAGPARGCSRRSSCGCSPTCSTSCPRSATSTSPSWCSSSTRRTCSSTTRPRSSSTAIAQTVRLIRSKGVGVFFVTQTPKDVPADVLAQLGNRVQHALRAFTPDDAKALKATASTFPNSAYDLEEALTQLGIGEAIDHRALRAWRPDAGRVDPAARPAVEDGAGRPGGAHRGRVRLAAAREVRRGRSTATRRTSGWRRGSTRHPPRRPRPTMPAKRSTRAADAVAAGTQAGEVDRREGPRVLGVPVRPRGRPPRCIGREITRSIFGTRRR